jgi:hypothetical protein
MLNGSRASLLLACLWCVSLDTSRADAQPVNTQFTTTSTPGEANYAPLTNVLINEVLSHTDPPLEDAVELYNPAPQAVDISGWFLSNTPDNLKKFQIPAGTVIPARGYKVLYEYQFNVPASPTAFTFNSAHGDDVNLSSADAAGNLTGYRARQEFEAAENGVSFGRFQTSGGVDFVAMNSRTFGADAPGSLVEFRTGTGLLNAYPKIGPIVINEIMYHPVTVVGNNRTENTAEEFIELYNLTDLEQPLFDPLSPENTWHLANAVDFEFPRNSTIPPRGFLVVVSFDPRGDSTLESAFRTKYSLSAAVRLIGPFHGKLKNDSDMLELRKPDPPQQPPHPDAGFVPYILVDKVAYEDHSPWPQDADGAGASLQRRVATRYGNDAVNWKGDAPTPGGANFPPSVVDSDGDGMPDDWEVTYGLNPNSPADAEADLDLDGRSNYAEYLSGTDPRDSKSFLNINQFAMESGTLTLRFTALANRAYTIQYTRSLTAADWKKLGDVPAEPTTRVVELTDSLPFNPGEERYFRLVTPPVP